MKYLRLSAQACVIVIYLGLCSALFYTNSKENDFPRYGKRAPSFLLGPLRRVPIADRDTVLETTDLSELYEKYPYLDPAATVGLVPHSDVVTGIGDTDDVDVDVDATGVDQLPGQRNKVYVMYDDSEANKKPMRRVPWTGPGSLHRRPLWQRYQP